MTSKPKYKLKVSRLDFISAVTKPAQKFATAAIIKRDTGDDIAAEFKVAKIEETPDGLGLIFGWCVTSTIGGEDHFDLQGDHVTEEDLVKAAADYAEAGAPVDQMHNEDPNAGRAIFLFPLTTDIASALGISTATTGLLCGLKVSPEVLEKFKDGTYSGFSIGGHGVREQVTKAATDVLPPSSTNLTPTKAMFGHVHLIADLDTKTSGTTTSATAAIDGAVFANEGDHTHRWSCNADGTISIAPALGHTHDLQTPMSKPSPSTMSKQARYEETLAKTAAIVVGNRDRHREMHEWLDSLGPRATEVAKEYADQGVLWAREYVAANVAKEDSSVIQKAAQARFAKAEVSLRTAVQRFQKASAIDRYDVAFSLATATDPATRAAYDELEESRHALKNAPIAAAMSKYDVELDALRLDLDRQAEQFATMHNMSFDDARSRLREISPTFAKMSERAIEAGRERDVARERAKHRAGGW